MGGLLVAIDGPAGSGKSSVARAVADRLGLVDINTGASYRAVALAALREDVDPGDGVRLASLAHGVDLDGEGALIRGERVPDDALRTPEVAAAASKISAHPELRRVLVERQREAAKKAERSGGAVVEGRDIGTVVLPDATLKIYLTASPEVRAQRRAGQLGVTDPEKIAALARDMRRRDEHDSRRADSPLRPAEDAVVVDSTDLDKPAVVERIVELARSAVGAGERP